MNRKTKYLFLTVLVLIVLIQFLVLHWKVDTIWFVTWFFLALTVQHDSRLSPGMGLSFLLVCPFLLIVKKEAWAEQLANYAYYFLAIAVFVYIEELILERFGWLDRKLNISFLWGPGLPSMRSRLKTNPTELDQQMVSPYRKLRYLNTAERSRRTVWLFRGGMAIVIIPLVIVGVIWVVNHLKADQLAGMKVSYDFIDQLDTAIHVNPREEGEVFGVQVWDIDGETKRVLNQPPAFDGRSRIFYVLELGEKNKLIFDLAMDPACWKMEGDGVVFIIYIVADGLIQQIFSEYIDPKHDASAQRWIPKVIDLDHYSGKTVSIIFETNTGPTGDYRYDWAGWGEPKLLHP